MVLLYKDKTVVYVPDCKMMRLRLVQNFTIHTAPPSLEKRHGQGRKCRRNLWLPSSALTPYSASNCQARWKKWTCKLMQISLYQRRSVPDTDSFWNRGERKDPENVFSVPHLSVSDPQRFHCVDSATREAKNQNALHTTAWSEEHLMKPTRSSFLYRSNLRHPKHDGQFAKSAVYFVHQAIVATCRTK